MRYVFFDSECSNTFKGIGKMCEFGYVTTDETFRMLDQGDYVMNPGNGRNCRFHLTGRKKQKDLILAHKESEYKEAPLFDNFYDNISFLLSQKDVLLFGFSVSNDIRFLISSINRYNRKQISYKVIDVQTLLSHPENKEKKESLASIASRLCSEEELRGVVPHRPDYDSYMTALILKHFCENQKTSIDEAVQLYPDSVLDSKDFINMKQKEKNPSSHSSGKHPSFTREENEEFNSLCDTTNPNPESNVLNGLRFSYSAACKREHLNEAIQEEHLIYDNGGRNHRGSVSSSEYIVAYDESDKAFLATKLDLTVLKAITIQELNSMIGAEKEKKEAI
jgi:oligoribonuclease (3'-5' exoribonuclease)